MDAAVASLLLVVASIVFACTVVTIAVTTFGQTINTQNMPELNQLKNFENSLLNQTNVFMNNVTTPQSPSPTP